MNEGTSHHVDAGQSRCHPGQGATDKGMRSLRIAWISVAVTPIAVVVAMVLGEGLLSLRGYESGGEVLPPIGAALLAGIPAVSVMIAPALSAVWFGFRARRQGLRGGTVPAVIGIVLAAYSLLANLLPRLLGM